MNKDLEEILDSVEKQATEVQYHDIGTSSAEQKLANALACLAAVVRAALSSTQERKP